LQRTTLLTHTGPARLSYDPAATVGLLTMIEYRRVPAIERFAVQIELMLIRS